MSTPKKRETVIPSKVGPVDVPSEAAKAAIRFADEIAKLKPTKEEANKSVKKREVLPG